MSASRAGHEESKAGAQGLEEGDPMADNVEPSLRVLRVVHLAFVAGLGTFSALAFFVRKASLQSSDPAVVQGAFVGLAVFVGLAAIGFVLQSRQLWRAVRGRAPELLGRPDAAELILPIYRPVAVVQAGLIEGPAFAALVVFILTGRPEPLTVVAVAIALLVARLPSRDRLERLVARATTEL
jgi:hypothetical protein